MVDLLHVGKVTILYSVFLYGLQGVLRFLARIDRFIMSPICADKNGLFTCIFSGRKKTTKEALTGQRLIEMDCILGGEFVFRGQQHHNLGITTGLVCMLSLFIT